MFWTATNDRIDHMDRYDKTINIIKMVDKMDEKIVKQCYLAIMMSLVNQGFFDNQDLKIVGINQEDK